MTKQKKLNFFIGTAFYFNVFNLIAIPFIAVRILPAFQPASFYSLLTNDEQISLIWIFANFFIKFFTAMITIWVLRNPMRKNKGKLIIKTKEKLKIFTKVALYANVFILIYSVIGFNLTVIPFTIITIWVLRNPPVKEAPAAKLKE